LVLLVNRLEIVNRRYDLRLRFFPEQVEQQRLYEG
jgi:hypothetical protein